MSKLITLTILLIKLSIYNQNVYSAKYSVLKPANLATNGLKAIQLIIALISANNNHKFQEEVMSTLSTIIENNKELKNLITEEADRIIDEIKLEVNLNKVERFQSTVRAINTRFNDKYVKYFMGNETYEKETIEIFVNDTLDPRGFLHTLAMIKEDTVPTNILINEKRVFEVLHDIFEVKADYHNIGCSIGVSARQVLFIAYDVAVAALSQGYVMVAHAYKYKQLQSSNPNAFVRELADVEEEFSKTVFDIAEAARTVMGYTTNAIRSCEPVEYVPNVNYKQYQFIKLFVPCSNPFNALSNDYIRRSLNGRRTESLCDGEKTKCISQSVARACLAPIESGRKYTTVIEQGGAFDTSWYYKGHPTDNCIYDPMILPAHSIPKFEACLCKEPYSQKKGALLNMTAQLTDIRNNRVITGIRLVTKWSITFIEIQEGILVNGSIDPSTVKWNENVKHKLEKYENNNYVLPQDFYKDKYIKYRVLQEHASNNPFNDDPHSERPIIDLSAKGIQFNFDDIVLPAGEVVTGVKFEKTNYNRISLAIAGTKVFNSKGEYEPSTNIKWYSVQDVKRQPLDVYYLDSPFYAETRKGVKEFSQPGKNYIYFALTHYSRDASQTLLPMVDLQEVVTNPPAPLGGLGMFYKRKQGYAGFLALKLITMDYSLFMDYDQSGVVDVNDIAVALDKISQLQNLDVDSDKYKEVKIKFEELWKGMVGQEDSNINGRLTPEKWMNMWLEFGENPQHPKEWMILFRDIVYSLFDLDDDGTITKEEFVKVYKFYGLDEEDIIEAFDKATKGKGVMTKEEFHENWIQYFTSDDKNAPGNFLLGTTKY